MTNEGLLLTDEEMKNLAEGVLDVLGLPNVERSDEENEVIRKKAYEWLEKKRRNEGKLQV